MRGFFKPVKISNKSKIQQEGLNGQSETEGVKAQQLIFIGFKAINLQSLSS